MSVPGNPVHTITQSLRWGDMDAYGHANNTVYFRFFEEARIDWFTSLGLGGNDQPTGPVIISTSATFLKEIRHPATIEVKTYVGNAGNSSLDTYYTLTDSHNGELYAEGHAKVVWVDRNLRTSTRLPDSLRSLATEA
ncbi:MAG: thioesterase family protein [Marinobacter sp.]|uniref:acyl-CoA thioesterase n=1 Tax=Marinobacter sp. TaxID=50741 RepID=UPI00299D4AE3|nr:thioesterase family protein [Marinobacter sp.]MDX1754923.1 thioesterase family protein [Marinobacter sp.]